MINQSRKKDEVKTQSRVLKGGYILRLSILPLGLGLFLMASREEGVAQDHPSVSAVAPFLHSELKQGGG